MCAASGIGVLLLGIVMLVLAVVGIVGIFSSPSARAEKSCGAKRGAVSRRESMRRGMIFILVGVGIALLGRFLFAGQKFLTLTLPLLFIVIGLIPVVRGLFGYPPNGKTPEDPDRSGE